jgi:hypothetical protein
MKQITKSYLQFLGITDVKEDGTIFTKRGPISPVNKPSGYTVMKFSGVREDTKPHEIKIHQIVYAWHYGEVPYGKVVHHKDRNKANNSIKNLVAMTPEEHQKEHMNSTRELKCRLDIPRAWYVKKIEEAENLKTRYGASRACILRAKLRYYDAHIEDAQKKAEYKKDCMELAYWKQVFKPVNKRLWKECCTIERAIKTRGQEAWPMIKHALEVIHTHYERTSNEELN